MKTKKYQLRWFQKMVLLSLVSFTFISCEKDIRTDGFTTYNKTELKPLSAAQKEVLAYLPKNIVIAHRGSEFWAPEESEAAMRWARNIGADYLEIDLQRTKDGVMLALHDENLTRTTNISTIFPNRQNGYVSEFTYEELLKLDIGSWFNDTYPDRARSGFVGQDVLTFEDVLMIAEGKRIKRDANGKRIYTKQDGQYIFEYEDDPADNGNRPGVYVETKAPFLFYGIEQQMAQLLTKKGWYHDDISKMRKIPYKNGVKGEVDIANTPARVILQTFDPSSLIMLKESFKRLIPLVYLIFDINSNASSYTELVNYGIENGASIIAPNIDYIPGYPTSLYPWQGDIIRKAGLDIHAWSFNTQEEYIKYTGPWSDPTAKGGEDFNYLDGSFTNLADLAINYYNDYLEPLKAAGLDYFRSNKHLGIANNIHNNKTKRTAQEVLDELGY